MRIFLFFLLGFMIVNIFADAMPLYSFNSPAQSKEFSRLTHQLRCLVCQDESLADSQASFAKDVRGKIYQLVRQGENEDQIKNYLTSRYGNFILFKPPINQLTFFLWATPFLLLALGAFILVRLTRKKK